MISSHIISSESLINSDSYELIIQFSNNNPSIKKISKFLNNNFSIDITLDKDIINGFNHDSSNIEGYAEALCRPKTTLECSIVFKLCSLLKIPITISAGRTNLTGSATPMGGIILSITQMNSISNIDIPNKKITSSPGVYLEDLRNYVIDESNQKLIFPVDPTSRKEAMVGGSISCNASGFTPGEKGAMRYWVGGLELILSNGEIIKANRGEYISKDGQFIITHSNGDKSKVLVPTYERVEIKNASGPFSASNGTMDLIDLIVGSEGLFCCISKATLNLQDRPSDYLNLFIKLKDEGDALKLYSDFSHSLLGDMSSLSGFEYFGENCSSYMVHQEYLFDQDFRVGVYVQIPVYNEDIDCVIERWYNILINFEYITKDEQILSLNEPRNWKTFFEARHSIPVNALQKAKEYKIKSIITDTIVPPSSFSEFICETHKLIKNHSIDYLLFGHLGDCHLHFHLIPNLNNEKDAINCYRRIIQLSSKLNGVYSAEHGTGKRKKQDFIECYGKVAADQVKKCKEGFDPYFLLNSGNVVDK